MRFSVNKTNLCVLLVEETGIQKLIDLTKKEEKKELKLVKFQSRFLVGTVGTEKEKIESVK